MSERGTLKSARLFIALPLSKEIRRGCAMLQERGRNLIASVRWSDPEKLHLTLLFLGQIEWSVQLQIKEIIQGVANSFPPFSVDISGLGAFPKRRSPRVIWIGISEAPLLMTIQQKFVTSIASLGIPIETRPYRPHLTLGRIKKEGGATGPLTDWLMQEEGVALGRCEVKEIMLMESQLRPEGPLHKCLLAAPLRG
ncbi:MAG: RNA 2',3'-cyclic phosphodiesterase, partial [Nitrospiria bacterium]